MTTAPISARSSHSSPGTATAAGVRDAGRISPGGAMPSPGGGGKFSGQDGAKQAPVSWMLAIGLVFLSTGFAGASRPVVDIAIRLSVPQNLDEPVAMEEITMADLQGDPAPESPPADAPPEAAEETPPEAAEPMTEEDVVSIPEAAPIEDVVPLLEPKPVRRDPLPTVRQPAPPTQPRPRAAATAAAATDPGARPAAAARTAAGGTGAGGAGGAGPGKGAGGRGKFPQPPYPAAARAQGISGTVVLSISVNPDGSIASATVVGSSGSSLLDGPASAWVVRRWRWPAGGARQFRMPVTFRLH